MAQRRSPTGSSRAEARGSARPARPENRQGLGDLRYTFRPGGLVHWIQGKKAAETRTWEVGSLVAVEGFEVLVEFPGDERPRRFGSLWGEAIAATARKRTVARREDGRAYVLWNEEFHVLMFDEGGSNTVFNLVDVDRHPEVLRTWQQLAAADPEWATRPAPPDAPAGVRRAIYITDPPRAIGSTTAAADDPRRTPGELRPGADRRGRPGSGAR